MLTTVSGVAPWPSLPRLSASSWSYHSPTASSPLPQVDSTRIVAPRRCLHQMADADVVEHGVFARRRVAEVLVHGRGAFEQLDDVEPEHGGRQQARRRVKIENRPPTPSGMGNISGQPRRGAEASQAARRAGDRHDQAAHFFDVVAARLAEGVEEDAKGDGRFQRAAALADDDDAPALVAVLGAQQLEQAGQRVVVDVVALEVDPRPPAALGRGPSSL